MVECPASALRTFLTLFQTGTLLPIANLLKNILGTHIAGIFHPIWRD